MVANPEICRANGKKSRGPVTQKGKSIASQNSNRHGLLSVNPPLVLGEDLEIFQGCVKSLIDEYQPTTATEKLLVQQVAMGWLKLNRLWQAEAAIANLSILRAEMNFKFPDALQSLMDLGSDRSGGAELKNLQVQIREEEKKSRALPQETDKLARYERHILRGLNQALEQLATIRQQRQNQDSMGSYGYKTVQLVQ
ncbi:hypothetical protein [Anabaena subtropica]|uniref:Uncharacterized protein n=1 Tax=Anabaena subtropica FACHB-260 TaxID=2692884 RepID=A0ABR8CV31_9NOST|nr:hypothetical protein [Anabaena subtropica]MBD2346834.1 hypothetical protein [Anabaena subtropica FACHB-260]